MGGFGLDEGNRLRAVYLATRDVHEAIILLVCVQKVGGAIAVAFERFGIVPEAAADMVVCGEMEDHFRREIDQATKGVQVSEVAFDRQYVVP